jgi:hypothetical protein
VSDSCFSPEAEQRKLVAVAAPQVVTKSDRFSVNSDPRGKVARALVRSCRSHRSPKPFFSRDSSENFANEWQHAPLPGHDTRRPIMLRQKRSRGQVETRTATRSIAFGSKRSPSSPSFSKTRTPPGFPKGGVSGTLPQKNATAKGLHSNQHLGAEGVSWRVAGDFWACYIRRQARRQLAENLRSDAAQVGRNVARIL